MTVPVKSAADAGVAKRAKSPKTMGLKAFKAIALSF
jgi:hypothetical protein